MCKLCLHKKIQIELYKLKKHFILLPTSLKIIICSYISNILTININAHNEITNYIVNICSDLNNEITNYKLLIKFNKLTDIRFLYDLKKLDIKKKLLPTSFINMYHCGVIKRRLSILISRSDFSINSKYVQFNLNNDKIKNDNTFKMFYTNAGLLDEYVKQSKLKGIFGDRIKDYKYNPLLKQLNSDNQMIKFYIYNNTIFYKMNISLHEKIIISNKQFISTCANTNNITIFFLPSLIFSHYSKEINLIFAACHILTCV